MFFNVAKICRCTQNAGTMESGFQLSDNLSFSEPAIRSIAPIRGDYDPFFLNSFMPPEMMNQKHCPD